MQPILGLKRFEITNMVPNSFSAVSKFTSHNIAKQKCRAHNNVELLVCNNSYKFGIHNFGPSNYAFF